MDEEITKQLVILKRFI